MPSQPPKEQVTRPLAEVVTFQKGKTATSFCDSETPGAKPYLLISDFFSDKPGRFTDQNGLSTCSPADTLVAWDGATAGKCATGLSGVLGSTVMAMRPRTELLVPRFLYWWFHQLYPKLNKSKRGAGVPHLSSEFVGNLQIPLPPLHEQNRVVQILDEADAIRRARATAEERTSQLTQAIFLEMFGDPFENSKQWQTVQLRKVVSSVDFGISEALSANCEYQPGKIAVLRIANLTGDGRLDLSDLRYLRISERKRQQLLLKKGDLLFNWRNSPKWVGKTAIFDSDEPCIFASFLYRIRTDERAIDRTFLWFYLNYLRRKGYFESKCRRAVSQANFGREELADVEIVLPPMNAQQTFANRVNEIRSLQQLQTSSRQRLDELFDGLLADAFGSSLPQMKKPTAC